METNFGAAIAFDLAYHLLPMAQIATLLALFVKTSARKSPYGAERSVIKVIWLATLETSLGALSVLSSFPRISYTVALLSSCALVTCLLATFITFVYRKR